MLTLWVRAENDAKCLHHLLILGKQKLVFWYLKELSKNATGLEVLHQWNYLKEFYVINSCQLIQTHGQKKICKQIINTSMLFFAFSSAEALIGFLSECGFQPYFALKTITVSGFLCHSILEKITVVLKCSFPRKPWAWSTKL